MTTCDDDQTCDSGERLLARLEKKRRPAPSELAALIDDVREAVGQDAAIKRSPEATDRDRYHWQLAKWRAIHRFMHDTPYRDRAILKRSDQWRSVLDRVRPLGELELIDWVALQVEVATNREKGIPDMRPRKNGPSFLVMLEYVANRKRKALALLKWAIEADRNGVITTGQGQISERLAAHYKAAADSNPGNQRL